MYADLLDRVAEADAELAAELGVRLRQQEAIASVGRLALSGASLDELARSAVEQVAGILGVDLAGYLQCTQDPGFVRAVAGVGWPAEHAHDGRLQPVMRGGPTEQALRSPHPVVLDERHGPARPSPILRELGIRSSLLVAIGGEQPVGVFGVHARSPRRFDDADATFLAAIGNLLALALQRLESERVLRHLATHDPLTDVANRTLFRRRLAAATADPAVPCALLVLDLDGFKDVNDRHGHLEGDAALADVARHLHGVIRAGDLLARLGGDEFAILVPGVASRHVADSIGSALVSAVRSSRRGPTVLDASVGVALWPEDGADADELLRAADRAMYDCKQARRS